MSKINEGVILKTVDYSENDKIITIFTPYGVVTVIAKSLKNGKRANFIDIGNYISYQIVQTKGLPILTSVRLINSYPEDKEKYPFYLMFIVEVILKIQRNDQDEKDLFSLIIFSLSHIFENPKLYLFLFITKLLIIEGVFIDLNNCLKCGDKFSEKDKIIISSEGIFHEMCTDSDLYISIKSLKLLKYLYNFNIKSDSIINIDLDGKTSKELQYYLLLILENFLESDIKSKKYLY